MMCTSACICGSKSIYIIIIIIIRLVLEALKLQHVLEPLANFMFFYPGNVWGPQIAALRICKYQ